MSPNSKNCYICDFSSTGSENLSQHVVCAHFKSTEMLHLSSIPDSVGYYHSDACVAWTTTQISYLKRHYSKIHHGAESLPGKAPKIQHSGNQPPLECGNANIPDEILNSCSAGEPVGQIKTEHHDAESTANDILRSKLDIKRNASGVTSLKGLQITFSPSGHQESERKPYQSLDFS